MGSETRAGTSAFLAIALLAAAIALTCELGGGPDSSSAAPAANKGNRGEVKILAPKEGRIASASSVVVRIRAKGKRFRVRAAGREVTKRFGRPVNGIRTARLVRGRDYQRGQVPLFAAVGSRLTPTADGVVFYAAENRESMVRLGGLKPRADRPLVLRGRIPKHVDTVRLLLNRRRVPVDPRRRGVRKLSMPLGADDGLRPGRNQLSFLVHRKRGFFDAEELSFVVPGGLAIAGAGPNRDARPGHAVTLDGSASIPSSPQHQLDQRWDIVEAPPGAEARIVNSGGQTASFVANAPGDYVARLTVGSGPPAAVATSRSAAVDTSRSAMADSPLAVTAKSRRCKKPKGKKRKKRKCKPQAAPPTGSTPAAATPSPQPPPIPTCTNGDPFSPPPENCPLPPPENLTPLADNLSPPIQDLITIQVLETISPMGYPVQTITKDGDIHYGAHAYKPPKPSGRSTPANWVHMLIINGATGNVAENLGFDIDQSSQLLSAVNATSGNELVMLTGQGVNHANGWSKSNTDALSKVFGILGGTTRSSGPLPSGAGTFNSGAWSIIGTNGLAEGQAAQNSHYTTAGVPEIDGGARGKPGSVNGYVQEVLTNTYEYVSPEFVPIDTNVNPADKSKNTIQVADKTHTSDTLAAGQSGFHLLVLNGDDPTTVVEQKTYITDLSDTKSNNDGVKALADQLAFYNEDQGVHAKPPVLILQSINRPHAFDAPAWVNDSYGNDDDAGRNQASNWSKHGNTLAGQVGVLAGPAAHDELANLGHDDTYVKRNGGKDLQAHDGWVDGGYTMIGTPFEVNGEEDVLTRSQAGSGLPDARVVGGLTRNAQSQLVLRNPATSPGFNPNQMHQIAFQAAQPWMTGATRPEQEANAHIARIMFPDNAPPDVRAYYQEIGQDWGNRAAELNDSKYDYPSGGTPLFDSTTYSKVKSQLQTEMQYVEDVRTAVLNFQKVFGASKVDALVNQTTIANSIIDSIEPPLVKETFIDPTAILSDAFFLASSAAVFAGDEAAPVVATFGIMGSGAGIIEASFPQTKISGGTPVSQAIVDEAGKIAAALTNHYSTIGDGFTHLYALMVSDWGKLQSAEAQAGIWSNAPQDLLEQTFATAAKQEFVRGLMPVAFHNYRIHPAITSLNGSPAQAETYRCIYDSSSGTHSAIFNSDKAKNGAARAGQVRWTPFKLPGPLKINDPNSIIVEPGDGAQGSVGWIMGQALSSKIDWGNERNGIVADRPRIPPADLMKAAFSPVAKNTGNRGVNPAGNPGPLQMDNTRFFGDPAFTRHGITCAFQNEVD